MNYLEEHLAEIVNGVGKIYVTDHLGSILNAPMAGSTHSYGLIGETGNISISPSSSPSGQNVYIEESKLVNLRNCISEFHKSGRRLTCVDRKV